MSSKWGRVGGPWEVKVVLAAQGCCVEGIVSLVVGGWLGSLVGSVSGPVVLGWVDEAVVPCVVVGRELENWFGGISGSGVIPKS